jgi:hypothetical protein
MGYKDKKRVEVLHVLLFLMPSRILLTGGKALNTLTTMRTVQITCKPVMTTGGEQLTNFPSINRSPAFSATYYPVNSPQQQQQL